MVHGGQGGIRTRGTFVQRFSRPSPSTARTPVHVCHPKRTRTDARRRSDGTHPIIHSRFPTRRRATRRMHAIEVPHCMPQSKTRALPHAHRRASSMPQPRLRTHRRASADPQRRPDRSDAPCLMQPSQRRHWHPRPWNPRRYPSTRRRATAPSPQSAHGSGAP